MNQLTTSGVLDSAGRLVIPKLLRESLGLTPGQVEVTSDGAALRVEPISLSDLEERAGRLRIPSAGTPLDAETVRALRDADQK